MHTARGALIKPTWCLHGNKTVTLGLKSVLAGNRLSIDMFFNCCCPVYFSELYETVHVLFLFHAVARCLSLWTGSSQDDSNRLTSWKPWTNINIMIWSVHPELDRPTVYNTLETQQMRQDSAVGLEGSPYVCCTANQVYLHQQVPFLPETSPPQWKTLLLQPNSQTKLPFICKGN